MPPLDIVIQLVEQYGYVFLFLIAIVEGPIITIIGGFLAAQGLFNIFIVYVVVLVGDVAGDVLYYGIGRAGRHGAFAGLRSWLGITRERFAEFEQYIERAGGKMLIFAKFSQTGFLALPASGAAGMPLRKFLAYNILGSIPKSLILVLVGYFFGYAYNNINNYFQKLSLLGIGILCIVGLYFLLRPRHAKS